MNRTAPAETATAEGVAHIDGKEAGYRLRLNNNNLAKRPGDKPPDARDVITRVPALGKLTTLHSSYKAGSGDAAMPAIDGDTEEPALGKGLEGSEWFAPTPKMVAAIKRLVDLSSEITRSIDGCPPAVRLWESYWAGKLDDDTFLARWRTLCNGAATDHEAIERGDQPPPPVAGQ